MPLTRTLRSRGSTIVVTAFGETLFLPTGPVPGFTRRLSETIKKNVVAAAPRNKRPRWAHYGPPLKQSFTSKTAVRAAQMRSYFAIGSRAGHAAFVDQGTGIYNGGGIYGGKILPPWRRGQGSLYEATWSPTPQSKPLGLVEIKGQKGQYFFDRGMDRGFRAMGIKSYDLPGNAPDRALAGLPLDLVGQVLGPTSTPAFIAQLEEWREWREAWRAENHTSVRREAASNRREQYRVERERARADGADRKRKAAARRQREKRERDAIAAGRTPASKKPKDPNAPKGYPSVAAKQEAAIAQFRKQNPRVTFLGRTANGIVVLANGRRVQVPWSALYNLID